MIRVGVVGYGTMGRIHSQALQKIPNAELVIVADPDSERRAQAERDFGVDVASNIEEMLCNSDVDLVDICAPTYLHAKIMTEAIKGNKHIFCEKPLVRTLKEGQRLLKMVKGYDKKIGIGHVVRFTPAYTGIRESIQSGDIGTPAVARTFRGGSPFPKGWHDWFADFDLSGGVILDLTIHDIDYLRWLFGDVERVYAKSTHGRTSAHMEWAMIVLRFKNGVIAHVEGSWTNYPGAFYTTVEIAGKDGLVSYDSRETKPIFTATNKGYQAPAVSVPNNTAEDNPYYLELLDMVEAIRLDRSPLVTVEDAFGSLKVALAAVESAQTGQVITL
ncbi:MAG: Gfo/Idh/MocA family oxidoreductase [Firmicutes bacterium]|nr:Gfo/Idh/MocA family oxidoreductase [Bacillota bacterium]